MSFAYIKGGLHIISTITLSALYLYLFFLVLYLEKKEAWINFSSPYFHCCKSGVLRKCGQNLCPPAVLVEKMMELVFCPWRLCVCVNKCKCACECGNSPVSNVSEHTNIALAHAQFYPAPLLRAEISRGWECQVCSYAPDASEEVIFHVGRKYFSGNILKYIPNKNTF